MQELPSFQCGLFKQKKNFVATIGSMNFSLLLTEKRYLCSIFRLFNLCRPGVLVMLNQFTTWGTSLVTAVGRIQQRMLVDLLRMVTVGVICNG